MMMKFGSIYYAGNMLIRNLCEHDTDILFTSAFKMAHDRKIWHFNRANSAAIKSSMTNFPWLQHLNLNTDTNWQVKTFTDIFLNIMPNFIPNVIKRFVPRDPPWITKPIKTLLNKKNRLFKNYKKHGYKREDRDRLDTFRMECQQVVESAKLTYLKISGNKVNDPGTSQKSYWKIINRVMNKCRAPKYLLFL